MRSGEMTVALPSAIQNLSLDLMNEKKVKLSPQVLCMTATRSG